MFTVVISEKGGPTRQMNFDKTEVTVGRVQGNDIILPKGNVSKRHSRVVLKDGRFIVVDLKSTNGTYVNGRKITSPLVVKSGDKIYVGDFILTLEQVGVGLGAESSAGMADAAPPAPPPLPGGAPAARGTMEMGGTDDADDEDSVAAAQAEGSNSSSVPSSRFSLDQEPAYDDASVNASVGRGPALSEPIGGITAAIPAVPSASSPGAYGSGTGTVSGTGSAAAIKPFAAAPPPRPAAPPPMGAAPPAPAAAPAAAPPAPAPAPAPAAAAPLAQPPARETAAPVPPRRMPAPTPAASATDVHAQPRASTPERKPFDAAPPSSVSQLSGANTSVSQVTGPSISQVSAPSQVSQVSLSQVSKVGRPVVPANPSGLRGALQIVIAHLSARFDLSDASTAGMHDAERHQRAEAEIADLVSQLQAADELPKGVDPEALKSAALREAVGLGALEGLLSDNAVREVVVEGPGHVVADHGMGLKTAELAFSSSQLLTVIAHRLIAQAGTAVIPGEYVYRVTLPYGPQVTVILPPIAVRGPVIEIRRMTTGSGPEDLVKAGLLDTKMLDLLRGAVVARRNIVVVGPAGSGVTRVLSALASYVDRTERIVTVEDVPDLAIEREHLVSLAASSHVGGPQLRHLVRQAATMRADRLIVDDVNGGELFDVFSVLAARRPGNLVGVHAETDQALSHLPLLVQRGSDLSKDDAATFTAEVANIVVSLAVDDDGDGVVSRIVETQVKAGDRQVKDLWVHEGGRFVSKGNPSFGS